MSEQQQELTPEQQKQIEKAQKFEQRLLNRFQMELGRLSGQLVVDRANFEQAQEEWQEREQDYLNVIERLTTEVQTLRDAQKGTDPSDEPVDISKVDKVEEKPRKRT